MCVFCLSYPTRYAHAPYCHPWPAWLYHIFPHYFIKGTIFGRFLNIKRVFCFYLQRLSKTLPILRVIQGDIINICLCVKYQLFLTDFYKTWIFRQIFRKLLKFRQNPSSGSRVVPCGRTDTTKLTVAFRNFSNAPKNARKYGYAVWQAPSRTGTMASISGIITADFLKHTQIQVHSPHQYCGSSVWKLLRIRLLVSKNLRWFLDFRQFFALCGTINLVTRRGSKIQQIYIMDSKQPHHNRRKAFTNVYSTGLHLPLPRSCGLISGSAYGRMV